MAKHRLRGRFALQLRRPKDSVRRLFLSPVQEEMQSDSRTLLIAFGGLRGRIDVPQFEFLGLTGDFPIKRLYVRDLYQAWYQQRRAAHRRGECSRTSLGRWARPLRGTTSTGS